MMMKIKSLIKNNLVIILSFFLLLLVNVTFIYNLYLNQIKRTMYINTKMYNVLYQMYEDIKHGTLNESKYNILNIEYIKEFYVQEEKETYEIISDNKIVNKKSKSPIFIKEAELKEFEGNYVFYSDDVFMVYDKKHNIKSKITFNNNYKLSNFNLLILFLIGVFLSILIIIIFNIAKRYNDFLLSDKISDTINTFKNTSFIVSNFNHEINTPLINIEKNIYVLEQLLKNHVCNSTNDEIKVIDNINNDILFIKKFMSKITSLKLISKHNYSSKSIYYYLDIIKDTLRNITTTKLDIQISEDFKKYNVNIPREYLYSIFMNMFKNSYEADSSRINLSIIKINNNKLHIRYEDNGTGILKNPPSAIFESSISTKSTERGFGMYFVKTVLKTSGGNIRIRKTDKLGTVFELIIPIKSIDD